ncbi:hypothetical protein DPMN_015339 [Dreissena polymorpha]|uniref:Uncharacterized protein n=1 Tax=Dreissena polymorpha TaxID=45954 RepID=A0A9D4BD90_DREPO|nr:hypothetical protein DPMN_193489 [Dreissena polymorpha]KAH3701403.1 hypothetical protein DPMN_076389 [Dreissena polymorpha]KAH3713938.1 hypothetical protein DPMN_073741 [Dreissena polymorpha]KAH3863775.1 hypothetical protein DPMN_026775 [Dreissena polymorpha]KAH3891246.1 hypothetical protein DPMN_015339 [Dreissena polymorpha]
MEYKDSKCNAYGTYASDAKLYPALPAVPSAPELIRVEGTAQSYRLQKINEIQKEIATERDKRANLSKKYHRAVRVIAGVDNVFVVFSMVLGATGIGVLSTIIAAPIAIAMEGAALGIGLLSIVGSQTNKKLSIKAEKHEKIKTLADAKLNTISDLISKALADDRISDEEYSLILSELDKFNQMKEEIRSKIRVGLDEQTKQSLIAKGRDDAILSFQNMFSKSKETFIKKDEHRSNNV